MNNNITEVPEGFKMTELGALPKEWETIKLKDILDLLRNGITKNQNKSDKGVPVSRIETISDERINPQKVGYIKDISTGAIEQYKIQDKDILFSHINSESMLGKTAIYNGQPPLLIHGMNLLLLRANEEICSPYYLNYLLKQYREIGIFRALSARAVGQASINQGKLRTLDIIFPPLPEQKAIAKVLSTIQSAIEAQDKIIDASKELKNP